MNFREDNRGPNSATSEKLTFSEITAMKKIKKNPLSKAQKKLLNESLKRLLGPGLIVPEPSEKEEVSRSFFLRAALNELSLK